MVRIEIIIEIPGVSDPDSDRVSQIVEVLGVECRRIAETIEVPLPNVWIDEVTSKERFKC